MAETEPTIPVAVVYLDNLPTRSPQWHENDRKMKQYLLDTEPIYASLHEIRMEGWNNVSGDTYFAASRARTEKTHTDQQQRLFMQTMRRTGLDMHRKTGAFTVPTAPGATTRILDICMAPGGFTIAALEKNPFASVDAITLPEQSGGARYHLPLGEKRVTVLLGDLTMFATEFGVVEAEVPADHPDVAEFVYERPFVGREYDLVLADGHVLRAHARGEHHQKVEGDRLTYAELILCLQRIKPGGTLVLQLHKIEAWDTILLLRSFASFSEVQLFKPAHFSVAIRGVFYMVAANVQPHSDAAKKVLERFKNLWKQATFEAGIQWDEEGDAEGAAEVVMEEFGEKLRELARETWGIQEAALRNASFTKRNEG